MNNYLLQVYRKSTGERVWQAPFKNKDELIDAIVSHCSASDDFMVKVTEI